jgi:hypothetical protein
MDRFYTSKRFSFPRFWRNTRLEKHNDPLNTDPPTPPAQGPRETICGACGCRIARNGEILSTGETYKRFLQHEQTIEAKDREIARMTSEITALKEKISALEAQAGERHSTASRTLGQRIS